jgi:hypothetical protein
VGTTSAPRIDDRLRSFIAASGSRACAADVTRGTGALAEELGLARPSYQQVRVILREATEGPRPIQRRRAVSGKDLALDIWTRNRPATDLENWLYGDPLPWRRGARNEPRDRGS